MSPPGGGRGGAHKGPQLPWLLQQQVGSSAGRTGGFASGRGRGRGGSSGGGGLGGGRGSGFTHRGKSSRPASRKELRKAARQEKKHHKFEVQQQKAQLRHVAHNHHKQQQQQQVGSKRPLQRQQAVGAPAAAAEHKAKKQKLEQQQQQQSPQHNQAAAVAVKPGMEPWQQPSSGKPHKSAAAAATSGVKAKLGSSKTKFYEMLEADGVAAAATGAASNSAFLADLKMEREMARKLKIKKGSKRSGPEDGLDAFLSGITAGSSQLPVGVDPAAAAAAADASDDYEGLSSDEDQGLASSDEGGEGLGLEGLEDLDEDEGFSSEDDDGEEGFSDEDDEGLSEDGDDGLPGFGMGESREEDLGGGSTGGEDEESGGEFENSDDSLQDGNEDEHSQDAADSSSSDLHGRDGQPSDDGEYDDTTRDGSSSSDDGEQPTAAAAVARPKAAALAPQAAAAGAAKYVPPALRKAQEAAAAAAAAGGGGAGDGLAPAVQRRITGLLNRLAESNLQPIARDILTLYETEGRRLVSDAVSAGLLAAVAEGPRATEQFAAVVAVFVGGLAAGARAQDMSARFLEMLVARLEQARAADDGLACHNLIMLLAYCYSAGVVAADCMYSVLGELTRRFSEADVAMMLTLLNAVGLQLRSADPAAMKDFVLAVHNRAAAAGAAGGMTKRAEIMLELVMDIKNNRQRDVKASRAAAAAVTAAGGKKAAAAAAGAAAGRGGAAAVLQPGLLKWLKQSGIDEVTLANISWAKLVQPNKKGMWWHPAATDAAAGLLPGLLAEHTHNTTSAAAAAAAAAAADDDLEGTAGGAGGVGGAASAGHLLQLAAGMRMTTDARRAAFVAIMGSEDCAEACEKLLRLPLKGDQSREVVRVLVECCLQEARFNPYYGHLAARLAAVSKSHKVTLQYCVWDQWKEVASTEPRRLMCLAGLVAHVLANFVLPLSAIKPVDFDACGTWTNKETFLWRHTMQQMLAGFKTDADSDAAFSRLAQQQALGGMCKALGLFLKLRVGPWLVAQGDSGVLQQKEVDICLARLARAEKILLSSTAAVLAG